MKNYIKSQHLWYLTNLPQEIVDLIEKDLFSLNENFEKSKIGENEIEKKIRNSKNTWIPTTHWSYGFIWPYICRANEEFFKYDITNIDSQSMQYTSYCEGEYYQWHTDDDFNMHIASSESISSKGQNIDDYLTFKTEYVRKISFSLLLSDVDDFEGGNFQTLNGKKTYFSPRKKGTLIIFDSRVPHRVLKVTKGERKSLVGWVVGPRWK